MRADVNLRLLLDNLKSLSIAPYFSKDVLDYNQHLCRAIEYALHQDKISDFSLRNLSQIVWISHQYLSGSVFREAPFEVQFCLETALQPWTKKKTIITTALIDEPFGYHFLGLDPWASIKKILPDFDTQGFDRELSLIGLPRLYRHKPIFCTPLYHELGHFVDKHWAVTEMTMLMSMKRENDILPGTISKSHWAEHFADLFSASYIGRSSVSVLDIINPGAPVTQTHPSNSKRFELVENFLTNVDDPIISALQKALEILGAPPLRLHHICPELEEDYDDLRPTIMHSDEYLHGIFESATNYFSSRTKELPSPWTGREENISSIEKIINDLTEKSIRNYSIKKSWGQHANT